MGLTAGIRNLERFGAANFRMDFGHFQVRCGTLESRVQRANRFSTLASAPSALASSVGAVSGGYLFARLPPLPMRSLAWACTGDLGGHVIAALVAAMAALLGVMIGRFWDNRSESARWRRDQKTASYAKFAEQFVGVYNAIRELALNNDEGAHDRGPLEERLATTWTPIESSLAAVWLHGSADVVTSATSLDRALAKAIFAVLERGPLPTEEWRTLRAPLHQAFEDFVDSARLELGLTSPAIRYFSGWVDAGSNSAEG